MIDVPPTATQLVADRQETPASGSSPDPGSVMIDHFAPFDRSASGWSTVPCLRSYVV